MFMIKFINNHRVKYHLFLFRLYSLNPQASLMGFHRNVIAMEVMYKKVEDSSFKQSADKKMIGLYLLERILYRTENS